MLSYEEFSGYGNMSAYCGPDDDEDCSPDDCNPDPCGPDYDEDCMPDCSPSEDGFDCCPYE